MKRSLFRHRPLSAVALAAGAVVTAGARIAAVPLSTAVLIGWCAMSSLWMGLVLLVMLRASTDDLRRWADLVDEGKWAMRAATCAAAFAALAAVIWHLAATVGPASTATLTLGFGTVVLSWTFLQVLFAAHYAHEYWLKGRGIHFPGNESPDFGEFLYFSFNMGMAFQVADATTQTPEMRRLVMLHGLVSFLFNAVILAAAVNVAAGLAQ
ncbi:MAG TPA: DUF1345 domain-containing protein [Crenalkalicoccus sp.]|jgi:uncharacterized membrane protein|nr:DUF1345 domain-containing protein [Crenalkalicoccus sp.]